MLVFLPTMYWYVYNNASSFGGVLLNSILITPLVCLLYIIRNKTINILANTIVFLLALLELVYIIENGNYTNTLELLSLFHANNSESTDLLHYGIKFIVPKFWLITLVYIVEIVLAVHSQKLLISKKSYHCVIASCLTIILGFYLSCFSKMRNCSPYRVSIEMYYMFRMDYMQMKAKNSLENYRYSAYSKEGNGIYVLAIGESMRYKSISIDKQDVRETTPLLDAVSPDHLVSYPNYCSSALFTQQSVPMLLTRATAETPEIMFSEKPITSAFAESGYKTIIISHKEQLMHGMKYEYLLTGSDTVIWADTDGDIPMILNQVIQNEDKAFVILHFIGNHLFYSNYPEQYNKWRPNYTYDEGCESDSLFINAYDNSILYSDYLLAACIRELDDINYPSALLFVSDHGEYIDARVGGHGFSYNPTEDEYHAPFIVWCNSGYEEAYPEKMRNAVRHKHDPICGDHVFWSVLDMAGIHVDSTISQKGMSVFEEAIFPHERYLLLPDTKSIKKL